MRRDNIVVWGTVSIECFGHSWKDLKMEWLSIDIEEMDDTLMWSDSTWMSIFMIPAFWIQHLSSDESLATLANYMIKVHYEFRWRSHEMRTCPRFWELSKVITGFSCSFPCLHRIEPYSWQAKQAPGPFQMIPFVLTLPLCFPNSIFNSYPNVSIVHFMEFQLGHFSLLCSSCDFEENILIPIDNESKK